MHRWESGLNPAASFDFDALSLTRQKRAVAKCIRHLATALLKAFLYVELRFVYSAHGLLQGLQGENALFPKLLSGADIENMRENSGMCAGDIFIHMHAAKIPLLKGSRFAKLFKIGVERRHAHRVLFSLSFKNPLIVAGGS